jgi:hypothetical protein
MASTFSHLKNELIGTGEQVGTWGSTTNINLGTAIEEAIVGSADVAFSSADVTLTLTNTNGTQAARHLRLNLTGTSGGARDLILGAGCQIDKPYIINNGLADTVTVKNTTGTGVAVPAGKTMWVYNNATNVVDVTNHMTSLTLGSALPVASGGTGQTSYTDGQLLIGNTSGNTLTKATLTGTSDQVTVTNGSGSITLSTPQSINTTSNVQFGSFGVGTAASGTTGEIRATNNVTAFYSSDRKFKENVKDIESPLEKVVAIGGKTFDWTDEYVNAHGGEDGYFINKSDFGVIAQDVQSVFPVAVKTRQDGSLAVDYEKLCSLAFAAIKELQERVKRLEG